MWFASTVAFGLFARLAAAQLRGPPLPHDHLSLSDLDWNLSNANNSINVPTPFVNQAHLALIDAGIIDDPNIGLNEGTTRWVGEETAWIWKATVKLSEIFTWDQVDEYFFVFDALDTFCQVHLGPHLIGTANNAFRSWVFNATEAIHKLQSQTDTTNLTLRFDSSWAVATRLAEDPSHIWFPLHPPGTQRADTLVIYEYNARNWARKQQSDSGWDWGPAYLPCGPIKPGRIIGLPRQTPNSSSDPIVPLQTKPENQKVVELKESHLVHSEVPTSFQPYWIQKTGIDIHRLGQRNNIAPDQNAPWVINITLPLVTPHPPSRFASATLSGTLDGTRIKFDPIRLHALPVPQYSTYGPNVMLTGSFIVSPDAVEKWFPATLGNPKLYELNLVFDSGFSRESTWVERVGFRTIVLDQTRYSQEEVARGITPGTKFILAINGHPFYVQGSSMIPIDTFATRANSSTITWLLRSAVLAHQNVLRVWGGGAYETDEFYDLCDEIGILAWTESVMACGAYPIEPKPILDNMLAETAENVQRLNRHPSFALWAGNNEGEGYLIWVNTTWPNGSVYFDQYDYLYNHAIRDVVLANTRSISYIPSSTTNGYLTLDPYVARYNNKTKGEIYGDQELYNYQTDVSFDTQTYPVARFVNEFGFHSMPSIYTWERVLTDPEAYAFNSTQIRAHDKHNPAGSLAYPWPADDGQSQMTTGVTDWYPRPNITGSPRELLAQWAYSTQVFQAAYMASEISYYRLGASRGENNMGALYWQLNDVWEGISWSSIEYTGRWKVFHYLAERVQDHVIISTIFNRKNATLDIYATSDLWNPVAGEARWTWYNYLGEKLKSSNQTFHIGPLNSTHLSRAVGLKNIVPPSTPLEDAWLHLELTASEEHGKNKYQNEQFFHPIPLKNALLRPSQVKVTGAGVNQFSVTAHGGVAVWVNVEHPPGVTGYFRDAKTKKPSNCFFLRPQEARLLDFVVYEDTTHGKFASQMIARSLWDNYDTLVHKTNLSSVAKPLH